MIDEFSRLHPLVNIMFYICVLGITMFQMHPVFIVISMAGAAMYIIYLKKSKALKYILAMVPVFLLSAIINPLFSHKGSTLLFYLFTGNPVTKESIIYGVAAGAVLVTTLLWFCSFNKVVTTDKILSAIGKILPAIAMMISMVVRFVPKYVRHIKETSNANKVFNSEKAGKMTRLKVGMNIFSITTTWALENSVDTVDSMRARGYGSGKRTSYSNYKLSSVDVVILIVIIILAVSTVSGIAFNVTGSIYYPVFEIKNSDTWQAYIVYIMYGILCFTPLFINVKEDIKWRRLKSKI